MSEAKPEGGSTTEPVFAPKASVDISNCDLDLVHFANATQPHGVLLVLEEPELRIVQASANTQPMLGRPGETLSAQSINSLLGDDITATLRDHLATANLTGILAHLLSVPRLPHCDAPFHLFGNRIDGQLLLEIEPGGAAGPQNDGALFSGLRDTLQQLRGTQSFRVFLQVAVEQMRAITGFDRVLAYRFDTDGNGEVVAEAMDPALEPYLGLHYPASDIPAPARRLFALSPLRHLPNVDYVPVPLLPVPESSTVKAPVDLSYSSLRSVSVMYTEYLRNMGVKATLVMPLHKNGTLWGLISCMHHGEPRFMPYERRVPVEFLGQTVSLLMGDRENLDHYAYRTRLDQTLSQLIRLMGHVETFHEALAGGETNLLSALDASGAVLIADKRMTLLGNTPTEQHIGLLADWLAQQDAAVFSTHRLAHDFPAAAAFSAVASGLLSIRLSRGGSERVIWFRPETQAEVHWAGDPNKPVEVSEESHTIRLHPRTSFALWKETVRGQSRPWLECELDYAKRLRRAIVDIIVERARLLARINEELQRSNLELDSFAYAASHDLKEPLRGIHNFAEFLDMEDGARLSEGGRQRLDTILRLASRMDTLLESLLHYSRVGRSEFDPQICPLSALVAQVVEDVQLAVPGKPVHIEIQPSLPVIRCNPVWVAVIFHNLIVNAVKYNDQPVKNIEIGYDGNLDPPVFFVRDNGIGIDATHYQLIFQLFRRLHGRDDYGGGTGAGLTIAQKAVSRHGGRIWVESVVGTGSTFYFTLAPPVRPANTAGGQ